MKTIILMRHGHAYSAMQSGVSSDETRPLSEDGIEGAIRAATELKRKNITPDCIISSPLLRAVQTAQEAGAVFGLQPETETRLSGAFSVQEMWEHGLMPHLKKHDTVLAIGHLPGIGILAGALLEKGELPIPAGGFYVLKLDGELHPLGAAQAVLDFAYL